MEHHFGDGRYEALRKEVREFAEREAAPGPGDGARAMGVHAAQGLYTHRPIERYLRDAHHIFAPAGTSDVRLLRLGEVAPGMDRGQWSDRLSGRITEQPAMPVG